MAGSRRAAARARDSGGWPTVPVTGPDGCVSIRPFQGLEAFLADNLFLCDLKQDFVLNDLVAEKSDLGVGQGPARLGLFS